MAALGDTFLMPTPQQTTPHLWVLITAPDINGESIAVNLTTQQTYSDTTTILNVGDHRYVRHATVINYPDTKLLRPAIIDVAIASGMTNIIPHDACSAALLQRIQAGLVASRHTPQKFKTAFAQAQAQGRT